MNPNLTRFNPEDREQLRRIMIRDLEFLRQNGLMDYSLLLAIERRSKPHESLNELGSKRNTITLTKGEVVADYVGDLISQVHSYKTDKKIFHIAIIDYL